MPLTMIGCDEALAIVLEQSTRLEAETCSIEQALGRVLYQDMFSAACLPPFDNAAMDGFALHVGKNGAAAATEFAVEGRQAAGDAASGVAGKAVEIMTGACVPAGLDTVVPVERIEVLERNGDGSVRRIRLGGAVSAREHIRRIGEDITPGVRIARAGERVQPQHLMLLASLGAATVAVTRMPRVAVICTGRELVDDPAEPLRSGRIRNGNGPFLAARIAAAGARCVYRQTVDDDRGTFLAAIEGALRARADVVLSTGAVSMGVHDFVPDALRAVDANIVFHKVRMRPGKPLLFARLAEGIPFFGLPGNPVAAAAGFRFFVEPMLRGMLGMPPERALRAPLAADFPKRTAMTFFLKARLCADAAGALHAVVLPGQESFRILPLAAANAWVSIPECATGCLRGALIDIYGLGHLQAPAIEFVAGERAGEHPYARERRTALAELT